MTNRQKLQQRLSRRMRQAAQTDSPEFSAGLHERIMNAIRMEKDNRENRVSGAAANENVRVAATSSSISAATLMLSAAAAVLILFSAAVWLVFDGVLVENAGATAQNDSAGEPSAARAVDAPRFEQNTAADATAANAPRIDVGQNSEPAFESALAIEQLALLDDAQIAAGWLIDPLPSSLGID